MRFTRMASETTNSKYSILKIKTMKRNLYTALLLAATFPLPVITSAQDKVIDQIVAVVGANIILKSDIEGAYIQNQMQGVTSDGDMKCEILENLLIDKLLLAEAELDTTIEATPSQINQQLEGTIQRYIAYFGSEKAVEDYVKKPLALFKAEMQDQVKNQLLTQQMQNKIIKDVTVTPSEVRAHFKGLKEDEIPVLPTQYEYAQITIVPQIDIEEENRIKAKLREIKTRIESGTSFAAMAVLYSEDPSAKDGGELPFMGRAELDAAYAAAAFNLKPGKVSNVIKSDFGYHIIELVDKRGEKIKTRHIIMMPKVSPKALEQSAARLDSLANIIRKGDIPFDQAAAMFSYDKNSRNNGGISINPETLSSKYSIEDMDADVSKVITSLRINEISDPFKTIDENQRTIYKIIKLINKTEGHTANLQNDYQQLAQLYLASKKDKTLKDWVKKKQSETYIHIDETYLNCNFKFTNWIK